MLETKAIHSVTEWEQLVASWPEANFLQSWWWGEFQTRLGKQVQRLATLKNQQVVGLAQGVIEEARRGKYLAVAGGPLVDWQQTVVVSELFRALRQVAENQNCLFMRIRPQVIWSSEVGHTLKQHGFVLSPMHLTADLTLQLDLTLDDASLLAQMRKQTRQNIRKAESLQIRTEVSTDPGDITKFYEQQLSVARRHKFVPFGLNFLSQQFQTFVEQQAACLIHAYQGETLLATAFLLFYNGEAVYHYGVSTAANLDLPGSYACQWRAIHEARQRGCLRYNFWGIAPKEAQQHRFAGVSTFKRGFGGEEIQYAPAHDLPLSPLYWLSHTFEQLRRKLRRLD